MEDRLSSPRASRVLTCSGHRVIRHRTNHMLNSKSLRNCSADLCFIEVNERYLREFGERYHMIVITVHNVVKGVHS